MEVAPRVNGGCEFDHVRPPENTGACLKLLVCTMFLRAKKNDRLAPVMSILQNVMDRKWYLQGQPDA